MVGDAPAHPCRSARRQCGRGECLGNRFQRKPGIQPLEQVIPIHTQLPAIRQINLDDFRLDEDLFLGPVEHGHHIANPLDDKFEELAKKVVEPLLEHQSEEKSP